MFDRQSPNPELAERQALVEERRRGSENRLAQERWRQTFRRRNCRPFVATVANAAEYAELKFSRVSRSVLDVAHLDPGESAHHPLPRADRTRRQTAGGVLERARDLP